MEPLLAVQRYGVTLLMNNTTFTQNAIATAHAFRCGYEGEGNRLFAQLLDDLLVLLKQVNNQQAASIKALIPVMFEAQKRRDTIYLADILEYELTMIAKMTD